MKATAAGLESGPHSTTGNRHIGTQ